MPDSGLFPAGSLGGLLRRRATRTPSFTALVDGTTSLSYRDLDARTDAVAAALLAAGVRPGEFVGVVADRTAAAVLGMLGVLRAGAAYVPIGTDQPPERNRLIVDDVGMRFLTGTPERAAALAPEGTTVVALPEPGAGPGAATPPLPDVDPGAPAYVIHTSGSTGRPKGCVVTHGNVLALLQHGLPLLDVDDRDRWTVFHSFAFDFSVWELWGALASGGRAVLVSERVARSPESLLDLLVAQGVTVLHQVPSVFRGLVSTLEERPRPDLVLRRVGFGGESVELDVLRRFVATRPGGAPRLVNMYGITETTVHVTFRALDDLDALEGSPIGTPMPHLSVRLLGPDGEPVGPGETGEMYVAGDGVAAGYLHRPELTAERFVLLDGVRHYRSGDLARTGPDGGLHYVGRVDGQVKVRGFRIELGEIEVVLRRSELVRDAVATVASTPTGAASLVACVVPAAGAVTGPELTGLLRRHLAGHLPRYMVPDRFEVLDALPLTASGKTDRRAAAELVGAPSGPGGTG